MASYGAGNDDDLGHVMIVEEISIYGKRIRVSEMNITGKSNAVAEDYRDTKWFDRSADGITFVNHKGQPLRFSAFPG